MPSTPRTKEELIDNIMDENSSFILGNGAGIQANETIRKLLANALLDEEVFKSTWKKFFQEGE